MNICLNALSAQAGGGISAFIELLPSLVKMDKRNRYFICLSKKQREIERTVPDSFQKIYVDYLPSNAGVRILWEQICFPFYLFRHRIDVLYSVGNTTTLAAPCKVLLLIENANPYSSIPVRWGLLQRLRNRLLRILGRLSAKRASKVRFLSMGSKKTIASLDRIKSDKCIVIPHGFRARSTCPRDGNPGAFGRYILTVSVVAPHKNIKALIRAFALLVEKFGYPGRLLIVGDHCYKEYVDCVSRLISELNLTDRIVLTGKIEFGKIGFFYAHAEAFIFSSIEETFGLPLLEAMGYGTPIAASDGSFPGGNRFFIPFREICGDAAQYFNPLDPEDMARGISRIINDPEYSRVLRERGRMQVKKYSWDNTAKSLIELFYQIGSEKAKLRKAI